ncbi:MAG: peptide chain release factor N(5)-glutamine methyltransferase [Catalinimonas sp.]
MNKETTSRGLLAQVREALQPLYDVREADALAFRLFEHHFGWGRATVLADRPLPALPEAFLAGLQRLRSGEPLQYVLGYADFDGLRFRTDGRALIPRPETEELVAWVASDLADRVAPKVLDVGTGTGAIAIALARRLRQPEVFGLDVSPAALALAQENAAALHAEVSWWQKDILSLPSLPEVRPLDALVSNPPYVPAGEAAQMHTNVKDHEPALALFVPDDDALKFYLAIARFGRSHLRTGGRLYFELHERFGREVAALLRAEGYGDVRLREDGFGRTRMVRAVRIGTALV